MEANRVLLEREGRGAESRLMGMGRLCIWGESKLEEAGYGVPRVEGLWVDPSKATASENVLVIAPGGEEDVGMVI